MTSSEEKERQLACLSFLYEAINETCRSGDAIAHHSEPAGLEENLLPTEIFLCKLAQICDSQKGGDTITAVVFFLHDLLNYVVDNPSELQSKPLTKKVLWHVLEFNIGRVGLYLKALSDTLACCIEDCEGPGNGRSSTDLQLLLAIEERYRFPIDMNSTENSRSLFLSNCSDLISIIQDAKAKGLAQILDNRARMPDDRNWCQLQHLFGRLHSYRQAADTIVGASKRRRELFDNYRVEFVSSASQACSLVPRNLKLPQLMREAFPDGNVASVAADIADLEQCGLSGFIATLQHRHRNKTAVHCEAQLHGYLHEQGKTSPAHFVDDTCFIAHERAAEQAVPRLLSRAWRLPDIISDDGERDEILRNMVEQMQDDTVSLLREKRALWRRNDSRTDSYAGFQSVLAESSMDSGSGGGVRLALGSAASVRSQTQTAADMPPLATYDRPSPSRASSAGSWGFLG
ncbi:hypothetical protein PWT90_05108 [Aphanocladium album]|nr:hypothetical protein PWT90_05108 [Aphanocladium album]